jgi:hypothetical protein
VITNLKVAQEVNALMLECSAKLNASVVDVKAACPEEEFANYRRAVARVMGEMLLGIHEFDLRDKRSLEAVRKKKKA